MLETIRKAAAPMFRRRVITQDRARRAAFAATLEAELERARRHHRPLAVVRITLEPEPRDGERDNDHADHRVTSHFCFRRVDRVFRFDGALHLIAPETDERAVAGLLERLTHDLDERRPIRFDVASFPVDGLTSRALLARLDADLDVLPPGTGPSGWQVASIRRRTSHEVGRPRRDYVTPASDRVSRILDVAITSLALLVALPLMAVIAVAIRVESPGCVTFYQERTGRDGRRFFMLKFRTMVANAEELKGSLAHLNVLPPPDFKIPNDPRITRVGRVLRRTSLDELPQLLNVLRGDMSLVGPRPTSFRPEDYELWHCRRLEVRPGLTGFWQLRGRNTTDFDQRLRLDIDYLDHRNVVTDVRTLFSTVPVVLRGTGN